MNERLILMTKRLFLSLALVSTVHAQWEQLPPLPEPNGGFFAGSREGKIVIVGGTNWLGGKKNWLSTAHMYDPERRVWAKQQDMPSAMAYGQSLQDANGLLLLGGSDGKQALRTPVDATSGKMTQEAQLPSTMVLFSGGWIGGKVIFAGGTDDAAHLEGVTSATYSYDHGKVVRLTDYPGRPFATAASAVARDELFVFGGMNYDAETKLPVNTAEAYAFAPSKNTWRKLKPLAAAARGLSAIVLDENHVYVAGGYTDDFTAGAVIYDVKEDSYRAAKPLPYAAMVTLVKCEGFVYCLGGEDKKQSRTDKFFRIPVVELLR